MSRAALPGGLALIALVVIGAAPAPTDLSEVLASPPTADYRELARSATVADGAYDFAGYSALLAANDPFAPGDTPEAGSGFTRAFARTWLRPPAGAYIPGSDPRRFLTEAVEEYSSTAEAGARFEQMREAILIPAAVTQLDTSALTGSLGVAIDLPNGDALFRVFFAKGNAVYVVDMISALDDLSSAVVAQARAEEQLAPAFTVPPAPPTAASEPATHQPGLGWQALSLIAFGVATIGLGILVVVQRRLEEQSATRLSI